MDINVFWTRDPLILYRNNNYLEFIPSTDMTRIQQMNALTRFCIYFLFAALIMGKSEQLIHYSVVVILFIVVIYYMFESDSVAKQQELFRERGLAIPESDVVEANDPFVIESGYYDFDGKLQTGKYYGTKHKSKSQTSALNYMLSDYDKYKKSSCRMPTTDNPYMNPLQTDFNVENPPVACNDDDAEISSKIQTTFNDNLFRDVSDVFGRENSQRQYYTVPQMNPPDQNAFAQWLYGSTNTCKTDQSKCLKYTDLRYSD